MLQLTGRDRPADRHARHHAAVRRRRRHRGRRRRRLGDARSPPPPGTVTATRPAHHHPRARTAAPGEKLRGLIEISSDVISGDSGGATYDDQGDVVGHDHRRLDRQQRHRRLRHPDRQGARDRRRPRERHPERALRVRHPGVPRPRPRPARGTRVGGVYPGTPAARAGITAGDQDHPSRRHARAAPRRSLRSAVQTYSPGDSVQIAWTDSGGTSHVATVTLIAGPIA